VIRLVLDTNVLVSALLQPMSPPAQVLTIALAASTQLCVSASVYAEYEDVLARPRFHFTEDVITG
jgi:uncharacterized protein